jgi:hypothetical protein
MENYGRRNHSEDGRDSATVTDSSGKPIANGGNVRSDDGSKPSTDGQAKSTGSTPIGNIGDTERSSSRDTPIEITEGFYFTPNGTIERIPSGYYIGGDGRLKKRRKRNTGDADGNAHTDRPSSSEQETQFSSEDFLLDKPHNVRGGGRKRKSKVKEETAKLTMVTMIATGCTALFTSVALLTGHKHWSLETEECGFLAEALNDAIATLPASQYAFITGIIEKWIPWINLAFVAGAIIVPRLEESAKRATAERAARTSRYTSTRPRDETRDGSYTGHTGSPYNTFGDEASVGWG